MSRRRRRELAVAKSRAEWLDSRPESLLDAEVAEQALRQLSSEYRQVVVLRIWGELSFAEIGEVMQLSVSTVHCRYRAALAELRLALEKPCKKQTN